MEREMKKKPEKALHLYMLVDGDIVSAHDPVDAWKVWKEQQDSRRSVDTLRKRYGAALQYPDDERLSLREHGVPRRRRAGVLAREVGRGWFASGTSD